MRFGAAEGGIGPLEPDPETSGAQLIRQLGLLLGGEFLDRHFEREWS
ncbi:MAG: hypothetical protein N3A38_10315 [Planctomycetota bacterium]|nr:hypothetical protein [Planctomycetota bacterium]